MKTHLTIGATPYEEDCAQAGTPNYDLMAHAECCVFVDQLRRVHGVEPTGARLKIKENAHDFGAYYEVVCYFDDKDKKATNYAYKVEGAVPAYWDDDARKALGF